MQQYENSNLIHSVPFPFGIKLNWKKSALLMVYPGSNLGDLWKKMRWLLVDNNSPY